MIKCNKRKTEWHLIIMIIIIFVLAYTKMEMINDKDDTVGVHVNANGWI